MRTKTRRQSVLRWAASVVAIGAASASLPGPAHAEDEDAFRPYLQFRVGQAFLTRPESAGDLTFNSHTDEPPLGLSVGADINRYFGAELAVDYYESGLAATGGIGKVGEIGMWTVLGQARLRYPLWDGRFVPYALVGAGIGLSEFNDRNPGNAGVVVNGGLETSAVGVGGIGAEYFIVDNVAVGAEARYVAPFNGRVSRAGAQRDLGLDSVLVSAGMRVYLDALGDRAVAEPAARDAKDSDALRGYLGLRGGTALFTDMSRNGGGVAVANRAGLSGGVVVGANVNRYLGFELASEYSETSIERAGVGEVGEYSLWTALAQARLRYPVMGDRLVPYVVAGAGLGFSEHNDRTTLVNTSGVTGTTETTFVGAAGMGVEYFLAENLAVGVEAKHVFNFDGKIGVDGVGRSVPLDFVSVTAGLRIFFP